MNEYTKTYSGLSLHSNNCEKIAFDVACEEGIELFINDQRIASILATPAQLRELAIGFLICEGAIGRLKDIKSLNIEDSKILVTTRKSEHFDLWCELRSSGCVGVKWMEDENILPVPDTQFEQKNIARSLKHLESEVYHATRGTHAACIINQEGECKKKVIDVGRHNAIDKVVGCALQDNLDLSKHFLLSTGRQSAGMVLKAARARIPLIVTKTAPFNSGIDAANRYNLTLICFARPDYMLVATHPQKIIP